MHPVRLEPTTSPSALFFLRSVTWVIYQKKEKKKEVSLELEFIACETINQEWVICY